MQYVYIPGDVLTVPGMYRVCVTQTNGGHTDDVTLYTTVTKCLHWDDVTNAWINTHCKVR